MIICASRMRTISRSVVSQSHVRCVDALRGRPPSGQFQTSTSNSTQPCCESTRARCLPDWIGAFAGNGLENGIDLLHLDCVSKNNPKPVCLPAKA